MPLPTKNEVAGNVVIKTEKDQLPKKSASGNAIKVTLPVKKREVGLESIDPDSQQKNDDGTKLSLVLPKPFNNNSSSNKPLASTALPMKPPVKTMGSSSSHSHHHNAGMTIKPSVNTSLLMAPSAIDHPSTVTEDQTQIAAQSIAAMAELSNADMESVFQYVGHLGGSFDLSCDPVSEHLADQQQQQQQHSEERAMQQHQQQQQQLPSLLGSGPGASSSSSSSAGQSSAQQMQLPGLAQQGLLMGSSSGGDPMSSPAGLRPMILDGFSSMNELGSLHGTPLLHNQFSSFGGSGGGLMMGGMLGGGSMQHLLNLGGPAGGGLLNGGNEYRIGAYTREERQMKIEAFRAKKRKRIWRKQIKYDCRKRLADTRPRSAVAKVICGT